MVGTSQQVSDSHCGHKLYEFYLFLSLDFFHAKENSDQPIILKFIILSIFMGSSCRFCFSRFLGLKSDSDSPIPNVCFLELGWTQNTSEWHNFMGFHGDFGVISWISWESMRGSKWLSDLAMDLFAPKMRFWSCFIAYVCHWFLAGVESSGDGLVLIFRF